jgi:hypothetical protein
MLCIIGSYFTRSGCIVTQANRQQRGSQVRFADKPSGPGDEHLPNPALTVPRRGRRYNLASMPDADFFANRQRHYALVLNNLFDPTPHMESHRLFEFVCALVRAGGLELGGLDPWYESKAIIDDMRNLALLDLPSNRFPDPQKTRIRLALLAYCTLTEMDLPYMLVANLLRLRLGNKYHLDPFHDLDQRRPRKKGQAFGTVVPRTAKQKLKRISELAKQANMEAVSAAFEETHDAVLRNAVYHSDFVLHDDSLFIRKASRLSKKEGGHTPRVAFDELEELITNAFALFSALFGLYERCRRPRQF